MKVQFYILFLDNFLLLYRLSSMVIVVCNLTVRSKIMDVTDVKILVTSRRGGPSLVDINDHLR